MILETVLIIVFVVAVLAALFFLVAPCPIGKKGKVIDEEARARLLGTEEKR